MPAQAANPSSTIIAVSAMRFENISLGNALPFSSDHIRNISFRFFVVLAEISIVCQMPEDRMPGHIIGRSARPPCRGSPKMCRAVPVVLLNKSAR